MRQQQLVPLGVSLLVIISCGPSVLANAQDAQEPPPADISHARVVSLSFIEGTVIARMPGSPKWAPAALDMPIQEGASIATAKHSFAEVQLENGSTIRLGELSRIDFVQMALAPHDGYVNHLTLDVGVATIHVFPKRHDEYILTASGATLLPHGQTEFRTDLGHDQLRVEVFKGRVQAADSNQSEELRKKQVLAYDYRASRDFQTTDTIQMDDWDKWVQARDREASLAAYNEEAASINGLLNGWDDFMPLGGIGLLPGGSAGDGF